MESIIDQRNKKIFVYISHSPHSTENFYESVSTNWDLHTLFITLFYHVYMLSTFYCTSATDYKWGLMAGIKTKLVFWYAFGFIVLDVCGFTVSDLFCYFLCIKGFFPESTYHSSSSLVLSSWLSLLQLYVSSNIILSSPQTGLAHHASINHS